ncbi:hypothetical protein [Alcanivorax sp.]|jgi:hypothetical protein|uniref:hypothetical protein n=1 Tax=Alcanivorax sp. TaxID=1872427 RepID=UPI0032D9542B
MSMNKNSDSELQREAYKLAEEVRDGKWNHIGGMNVRISDCPEITDELKRRISGFSLQQYQGALANGFNASK